MSFDSIFDGYGGGGADSRPLRISKTPPTILQQAVPATTGFFTLQDTPSSGAARAVIDKFQKTGFSFAASELSKKYQSFLIGVKFTEEQLKTFNSSETSDELKKTMLNTLRRNTHQDGMNKLTLIFNRYFRDSQGLKNNDTLVNDISSVVQKASDIVHRESPAKSIRKFGGAAYESHLWDVILILAEKNPLQLEQKKLAQLLLIAGLHDVCEDAREAADAKFLNQTLENISWLTEEERKQIVDSVQQLTVHTTDMCSEEKNQKKTDEFRMLCVKAANENNSNRETDLFSLVVKIADTVANSRHALSEYRAAKSGCKSDNGKERIHSKVKSLFMGYDQRRDPMTDAIHKLLTFEAIDYTSHSHLTDLISDIQIFLKPVVHSDAKNKTQIVFSVPQ
jgi:hypothetical protein